MEEMGLTLSSLTPEIRAQLEVNDDANGVAIVNVDQSSDAFEKGLRPGDLIKEVDHEVVDSPKAVTAAFKDAREGGRKSVLLKVERSGNARFVGLSLN